LSLIEGKVADVVSLKIEDSSFLSVFSQVLPVIFALDS
jgi:hypothetical protein